MGLIIIVERNLLRLGQSQLYISSIKMTAQTIIFCPTATNGNLIVISSRRQIHSQAIEVMSQRLHAGSHISGVPVFLRTGFHLHRAGQNNKPAFGCLCLFCCRQIHLHALIGDRCFMTQTVISKGYFFFLLQFQAHIIAIPTTARTIILIPAAAYGNLELINSLRQFPFELIFAIAYRLHNSGTISWSPVRASSQLALHSTHQYNVSSTNRRSLSYGHAVQREGTVHRHNHWCCQES